MIGPPALPRPDAPEPFTWFCCARLNRVKGHDTLIAAAGLLRARHPDRSFRIRIAGEDEQGGTGYRRDLEAAIAAAGLGGVVELLGSVTQESVRDELQSADGFVLSWTFAEKVRIRQLFAEGKVGKEVKDQAIDTGTACCSASCSPRPMT